MEFVNKQREQLEDKVKKYMPDEERIPPQQDQEERFWGNGFQSPEPRKWQNKFVKEEPKVPDDDQYLKYIGNSIGKYHEIPKDTRGPILDADKIECSDSDDGERSDEDDKTTQEGEEELNEQLQNLKKKAAQYE